MVTFDRVDCLCGAELQVEEIPFGDAPTRSETAHCPVCNRTICNVQVEGLLLVVIVTRPRARLGPSMFPASR